MDKLNVTFHTPGNGLSQYINCMVEIRGTPYKEAMRNFPVIKSELVVNLMETPFQGTSGATGQQDECRRFTLRGIQTGWYEVMAGEGLHIFVINFKPEAYQMIFGLPADEMTDQNVEADLCMAELDILWYKLMEAQTPEQRFFITEQWVTSRVADSRHQIKPVFYWLKEQISISPATRLNELARYSGYSRQNLYSLFKKQMGVSIKLYMEIYRLKMILSDMQKNNFPNLAALGYRYHFYDQNHFVKSFRRHTGLTPSQLQAQTIRILNHNQSIYADKDEDTALEQL